MTKRESSWHIARRRGTMIVLVALLPFVVSGALRVENDTTEMQKWLPEGQLERRRYDAFIEAFGHDDTLIVSWEGCALNSPQLQKLEQAYRRFTIAGGNHPAYFRAVSSGATMLDTLTSPPFPMPQNYARARLTKSLIGPDGQTTCLLLQLSPLAKQDPERVMQAVFSTAESEIGVERDQLRVGGGVYEAVVIDGESAKVLADFMWISTLVAFLVASISLRSLRLSIIVLVVAGYSTGLTIALVYYLGGTMNAVMTVLPTLVFVLVISSSVHLVNYYRDAVDEGGREGAAIRGVAAGWLPCTLAAITTAVGMLSLVVSQIEPVQSFGFFSAVGVIASLVVVLFGIPLALELWPGRDRAGGKAKRQGSTRRRRNAGGIDWVLRHRTMVLAIGGVAVVALGYGLTLTTSSVRVERMFRADNELIRNYRWIEKHIGPIATLEVVVCFDQSCELRMVDRLRLVQVIEGRLRKLPHLESTMSAGTMAPWVGTMNSLESIIKRSVMNKELLRHRSKLVEDHMLADGIDGKEEWWRITARLPAMQAVDYPAIIAAVEKETLDVLAADKQAAGKSRIECTGAYPSINSAQKQLLKDLGYSFLLAFVLICPVMMVILRSFLAGLVAMIGNVVPAVLVFGTMGWLAIPIEIGTVLTGSIALGIAVDDTLHFLTWHQRSLNEGRERVAAVAEAFRRCATAMTQTTLICGLSLLVFTLSPFIPASRFSILMVALLIAALVGDLILLPAILASPLGRLFRPTRKVQQPKLQVARRRRV